MFSYYERYDEEGRLGRGAGMLEFARMQELIGRFLAPPPQVVRTSTARKSSPPRLASGFRRRGLYSVQGPARFAPDLEARMANPARRAQLLDLIRLVEQEETLLGAATHMNGGSTSVTIF